MCEHGHAHPEPSATLSRRAALAAAGSGLLVAGTLGSVTGAIAETGATPARGASRASRLTRGTRLVHADLHNHTLMSDGDGDPALAFASMRRAGRSPPLSMPGSSRASRFLSRRWDVPWPRSRSSAR